MNPDAGPDRVAVVTGAARGINAAVVARLADSGWRVAALDRCADDPAVPYALGTREELDDLAGRYRSRVHPYTVDVRDRAALSEVVGEVVDTWGRLDAAVAGAAVMLGGQPAWHTDEQTWNTLLQVDVMGVANLIAAAVPALLASPPPVAGRFVALASSSAHRGLYHLGAYCAAKHAVVGMIRALACDLIGTPVTATAISPGSTDTPMLAATASLYGLPDVAELTKHQVLGRALEPDEVAAVVAFCCAPEAAALTGSVVHPDGGFTA